MVPCSLPTSSLRLHRALIAQESAERNGTGLIPRRVTDESRTGRNRLRPVPSTQLAMNFSIVLTGSAQVRRRLLIRSVASRVGLQADPSSKFFQGRCFLHFPRIGVPELFLYSGALDQADSLVCFDQLDPGVEQLPIGGGASVSGPSSGGIRFRAMPIETT